MRDPIASPSQLLLTARKRIFCSSWTDIRSVRYLSVPCQFAYHFSFSRKALTIDRRVVWPVPNFLVLRELSCECNVPYLTFPDHQLMHPLQLRVTLRCCYI